jgi:hypothetical protein
MIAAYDSIFITAGGPRHAEVVLDLCSTGEKAGSRGLTEAENIALPCKRCAKLLYYELLYLRYLLSTRKTAPAPAPANRKRLVLVSIVAVDLDDHGNKTDFCMIVRSEADQTKLGQV